MAHAEVARARALERQAENNENSEDNECPNPEKIIVDVQTFETSSMEFVNTKTKEVYVSYPFNQVLSVKKIRQVHIR